MVATNNCYIVTFMTDKFTKNQFKILHSIAEGFLSPLHNHCYDTHGKPLDPHYKAVLVFDHAISNSECKHLLKDKIKYPIKSVNASADIDTATKAICHVCHPQLSDYKSRYYDKFDLKWFGYKKDKPDYRLWFPYKTYTKSGLKTERGWTNKCLRYLPAPTDEKENYYYHSQINPAWNEFIVEDLEQQEPIKSILAKKNDPEYQKKKEEAAKKAKVTKQKKILDAGKEYKKQLQTQLKNKTKGLTPEMAKLAEILQSLTILNHIAKTLANNNFMYTPTSHSWLMEKLSDMYSTERIYDLKNQIEQVIVNKYPNIVKLQAYIPGNADKIWVNFCPEHQQYLYESYESPLEIFWDNPKEFMSCPHCRVTIQDLYYACYNFDIELNDQLNFDYHCPYPVGKHFFGPIKQLPQIDQMPNEESPFQFGHVASAGEEKYAISTNLEKPLITWIKQFDQSKFKTYPGIHEKGTTEKEIAELERQRAEYERKQKEEQRKQAESRRRARQFIKDHDNFWQDYRDYLETFHDPIYSNNKGRTKKIHNFLNNRFNEYLANNFNVTKESDKDLYNNLKQIFSSKKGQRKKLTNKYKQLTKQKK